MISMISILLFTLFGNNNQFDSQLKNYLDAKLKSYSKYEFQIMSMPKSFTKIEINNEKEFRINKNYGYVPIAVYSANNNVSSSLLTVRLKLFKEVLVSNFKTERNVKLSPEMFTTRVENISMVDGNVFDVSENLEMFRSRSVIRVGAILMKEMVEQIPLVNIGDKLTMRTGKNGLDVSVNVVARQEGIKGKVISVQAGSTIYKAKIIDKNNLKLEE